MQPIYFSENRRNGLHHPKEIRQRLQELLLRSSSLSRKPFKEMIQQVNTIPPVEKQQDMYVHKTATKHVQQQMIFEALTTYEWSVASIRVQLTIGEKKSYALTTSTWRNFHYVRLAYITCTCRPVLQIYSPGEVPIMRGDLHYMNLSDLHCTQSFLPCSCAGHHFIFLLQDRTQQLVDLSKDSIHCGISLHLNYRNQ